MLKKWLKRLQSAVTHAWSGLKWLVRNPVPTLWFAAVCLTAWAIWGIFSGIVGDAWISLPPVSLGKSSLELKAPPLPFYPTFFFLLPALMARPPRLRHPEESWVFKISLVPFREWGRNLRRGRLPFFELGPKKVKMNWFRRTYRRGALFTAAFTLTFALLIPWIKDTILSGANRDLDAVLAYEPPTSTVVYDASGKEVVCRFTLEDRDYVPIGEVPVSVRQAFVAAEDQRFYEHGGIDPVAIFRAAKENRQNGQTKQGGSTISQQVVKQVVLKTNEKSLTRKLREMFLVVELERKVSKDKILEVYLNHIYLGRAYGVRAAARTYFGKEIRDLTLGEAAFLAGMPKAPSAFSPSVNYQRAKERQVYVLGRMADQGFITEAQRVAAVRDDVAVVENQFPLNRISAPYFCERVRKTLEREYGFETVYKKGLVVHSTLDLKMQRAAEAEIRNGLLGLERDLGFNGNDGHDDAFAGCKSLGEYVTDGGIEGAEVVTNEPQAISVCVRGNVFPMHPADLARIREWEAKVRHPLKPGDTFPVQIRTVEETVGTKKKETRTVRYALSAKRTGSADRPATHQAAMVVVDQKTGYLKALVGGYDYNENQFDATGALRQTGSSVKPYIYLAALMGGKRVTDSMVDTHRCYPSASGMWCPENYLGKHTVNQYMGTVDLRTAMAKSLNSVSVELLAGAGVENGIRTIRKLGITSPFDRQLTIALGSEEVSLWEHTYAYATIAANGRKIPKQFGSESTGIMILKVVDASGKTLYEHVPPPAEQAVPAADAYALIYLMKGVTESGGTAKRVRELRRPAAGKTGTTNHFHDAWFLGFTADLTVGVWVGRQSPSPIGRDDKDERTGGSTALPIWLAFMKAAHPDTPSREFPVPDDVILVRSPSGELIPFQRGRVPEKYLAGTDDPF